MTTHSYASTARAFTQAAGNVSASVKALYYGAPEPLKKRTTRAQIAAAMVAVAAEHPGVGTTTALYDGKDGYCIQGAVMAKLGYAFRRGQDVRGGAYYVAELLNVDPMDHALRDALYAAQAVNDSRGTWTQAAEAFHRTLSRDCPDRNSSYPKLLESPSFGYHASWVDEATSFADTLPKVHVKA